MAGNSADIQRRLSQSAFSAADCECALRGQDLPENLGHRTARLCLVSGVRRNVDFARSAAVADLCRTPGQEIFARARNARLIMSNEVPSSELVEGKSMYPYCIWYPDVASEDTYRKLVGAFPDMRYQVGRACAVAGYVDLYFELDLLPDPSIAEEAREAGRASEGSRQIFEHIMVAPVRYSVMNDYELAINQDNPRPGAFLNADTAVRETLTVRKKYVDNFCSREYFNITEDWNIAETTVERTPAKLTDDETALLVLPLPTDLPSMRKDLLILVAAYEGNLDRYARLRRPGRSVEYELHCLVPGIYRSTAMALWLERNPDIMRIVAAAWDEDEVVALRRAIHARHIMNNDTHRLLDANPPVPDDELPYWVWYPTIPAAGTLCKLAAERPAMRPQCVRACIAGNYRAAYTEIMDMHDTNKYEDIYGELPLAVDPYIVMEAQSSPDHGFFVADLERRRQDQGLKQCQFQQRDPWRRCKPWLEGDISSTDMLAFLRDSGTCVVHEGQDWGMWESLGAELGRVRLYLSSPAEVRARVKKEWGYLS